MAKAKPPRAPRFTEQLSCLPCCRGDHESCRHFPQGGGFVRGDRSRPCRCEQEQHEEDGYCRVDIWKSMGNSSYNYACNKPAKGTIEQGRIGGRGTYAQPACGVHIAGKRRRDENERRWRAEWDANDKADERARETRAASAEWARRLRDEFGLRAEASRVGRSNPEHLRVEIEPEHLYGQLVELAGLLRDVGVDWPTTEETRT